MRGYFAIGAEGISKPMNLGALMRTANAFGAAFVFSVKAEDRTKLAYKSDTSRTFKNLPYYQWDSPEEMHFPKGIKRVGIELTDDAVQLPEFQHPRMAAYILGPERGNLSQDMLNHCDYVVKIPTRFCINLSLAGALVMYDRYRTMGHWRDRPIMPGGPLQG